MNCVKAFPNASTVSTSKWLVGSSRIRKFGLQEKIPTIRQHKIQFLFTSVWTSLTQTFLLPLEQTPVYSSALQKVKLPVVMPVHQSLHNYPIDACSALLGDLRKNKSLSSDSFLHIQRLHEKLPSVTSQLACDWPGNFDWINSSGVMSITSWSTWCCEKYPIRRLLNKANCKYISMIELQLQKYDTSSLPMDMSETFLRAQLL